MSLQQTLNEMKANLPFALEDVEGGPIETLTGRRGRKRAAVETLKRLKTTYARELRNTAVFLVVTGSGSEDFSKVATYDKAGCFHASANHFYQDLVNSIDPNLFGRENVAHLFGVMSRALESKVMDMDILEYPQLVYKSSYERAVNSPEDFFQVVRQAINEQVGAEIVGIQAVLDILDEAVQVGHTAPVTPIVLRCEDERLAAELVSSIHKNLTRKTFLVAVGKVSKNTKQLPGALSIKEASDNTVEQVLVQVREQIKRLN